MERPSVLLTHLLHRHRHLRIPFPVLLHHFLHSHNRSLNSRRLYSPSTSPRRYEFLRSVRCSYPISAVKLILSINRRHWSNSRWFPRRSFRSRQLPLPRIPPRRTIAARHLDIRHELRLDIRLLRAVRFNRAQLPLPASNCNGSTLRDDWIGDAHRLSRAGQLARAARWSGRKRNRSDAVNGVSRCRAVLWWDDAHGRHLFVIWFDAFFSFELRC